jgi:hypothetical protein
MIAIAVGTIILAGIAYTLASDPEFIKEVKNVIYLLVKAGYDEAKILEIMHYYITSY